MILSDFCLSCLAFTLSSLSYLAFLFFILQCLWPYGWRVTVMFVGGDGTHQSALSHDSSHNFRIVRFHPSCLHSAERHRLCLWRHQDTRHGNHNCNGERQRLLSGKTSLGY